MRFDPQCSYRKFPECYDLEIKLIRKISQKLIVGFGDTQRIKVTIRESGLGYPSSIPEWGCLHFTLC